MYEVSITGSFSAAHNLRHYRGKCENLHGHNWKVEIILSGKGLDNAGMLYDFTLLKKKLKQVISELDHKYLNKTAPFNKLNPTSENMAKYIYDRVKPTVSKRKLKIGRVKVWESDTSYAAYIPEI